MMFAKVVVMLLLAQQVYAGGHGTPGTSKCPCIDPVRLGAVTAAGGKVSFASPTTNVKTVPTTYGTGCKAWDGAANMQYSSSCTGATPASWCAKKWCYIDMCNCDKTDLGSSSYFTVDTGSNLKLGYSYDTCTTSASASSSTYLTDYCKPKDSTTCGTDVSCKVSGANCVPATKTQMLSALKCTGATGCQCIDPAAMKCVGKCLDGTVPFTSPTSTVKTVPTQYGAGCSAWDMAPGMEYYNDCAPGQANPPSWCKMAWCYIDMCQCNQADIASSTYFSANTALKLGYSYKTCGGATATTGNYLTTYCSPKDSSACASAAVCKVVSGSCTGKTSTEIKDGLSCSASKLSECSTYPDSTCPASATPAPITTTTTTKQTYESDRCTFLGMRALWALASFFLASRF